jgi:hypothetical protein
LDMHKAYDRVEWVFLENIMRKMGFAEGWITIMMACVRSVRYQVRFNSEETDMLFPLGAFDKVTHYHLTYSSFVRKVYLAYCCMKKKLVASMG